MSGTTPIDVTVPAGPRANVADIRDNWVIIEERLQALEMMLGSAPVDLDQFYLQLVGGTLTAPLQLPNGAPFAPALAVGVNDGTGFYRAGSNLGIALGGQPQWLFTPAVTVVSTDVDLRGHHLSSIADATNAADALNVRTADTLYASRTAMAMELATLHNEVAALRSLIERYEIAIPAGIGMRTEVLS